MFSREPLTPERVASLSGTEQSSLAAMRAALEFAASLDLAHTTSYRALVESEGGTLHVVVAAPANRLEPVTWWFPISGRVSYRGYFAPERAERFAADLAADGLDTYVRPAPLYSTLGFFDDPVPRSALSWPEPELVDTILHELVHQTVFVPGDVEYDEALATFVAHHATAAFYGDRPEALSAAQGAFADELTFARLLEGMRAELEAAYQGVDDPGAARALRAPIFARWQGVEFARAGWRTQRYQRFPALELSNAWVVANRAYEAVSRVRAAGFAAIVLTNQSGIGRGLFRASDYAHFEAHFLADFAAHGAPLDACYHCPHAPDAHCECRKPGTALALRAAREHGLELAASVVIGDKASDVALARALGCRAVLVRTGQGRAEDARVAPEIPRAGDVLEAVGTLAPVQPRV